MARIRSIKPEFPQSETIGRLSRDARLLFVQLWTIVDDAGRARAASRMLASLLYPYDDDASKLIDGWLDELEAEQCIRRYEVAGSRYLEIANWLEHQKIDRPSPSRLPEYREGSMKPREDSRASDADLGPRTLDQEEDQEEVFRTVAVATRRDIAEAFDQFWKAYPSRGAGGNPKRPALKLFEAAVRRGTNPAEIVAAVRAGVGFDPQKVGTEFIPQAVKWLRDCRYEDAPPPAAEQAQQRASTDAHVYVRQSESMWDLLEARWRSEKGKSPPTDRDGGWFFPRAWVPVHEGATC